MMKFSYEEIPIYQHNSNQFTTEYSVVALPLSSACLTPGVDDYHMDIFFFFVLFCGLWVKAFTQLTRSDNLLVPSSNTCL